MKKFCTRCFWLRQKLADNKVVAPWQIFPGIFSSIDSYSKKLVHSHFDQVNRPPSWLLSIDPTITGYLNPPSALKFFWDDPVTGIRLTGAPDAIFKLSNGTFIIADYKTSRLTNGQDELEPLYYGQLNAYRHIAESLKWPTISKLCLIYTEPKTSEKKYGSEYHEPDGFRMHFQIKSKSIPIDTELTEKLLLRAKAIIGNPIAPESANCKDCLAINQIKKLL